MLSFPPRAAIRDRVASIVVVDNEGGESTVLPSGNAVLGLQLCGRVRAGDGLLSVAGVTGIQKCARRYDYVGATRSVLVRFTPQGVACLGVPASELSNESVALDALLPGVREVVERFQGAGTVAEGVAIVEDFLARRPFATDPLVERALRLLETGPDEDASMARIARALSMSERQFERRFLERVGSTPKRYASLRRFERAAALVGSGAPLGRIAQDAGYYDQSHFIREFRRFAGMTPGDLRRTG
ncbi:MAG: AraC family transcriptional regulator [Polyangiaceae bacterium]